jgi:SAM-dependent methyltransferase
MSSETNDVAQEWERRYLANTTEPAHACTLLQHYRHLLPQQGVALDLACGRGGNALLLARQGLHTLAWDHSANALNLLQQQALQEGLCIDSQQRDVVLFPPEPGSIDVLVVSRFLHRPLCPALSAALRPGGLLFYQTFCRERPTQTTGPHNPDYLLEAGELLRLFAELHPRIYREEGMLGDLNEGMRGEAWLVAQKKQ